MARRWFSRKELNLESEKVNVTVHDTSSFKLNGLRILTTNDVAQGPAGPQGPPGIPTTLAAIGNTPNANGMTLSGSSLNLQPANGSFGGVITTGTQVFGGQKTFSNSKFLLPGAANNLPPLSNTNDEMRVAIINGTTGELSCYPYYGDAGTMLLDSGSITTTIGSNPPLGNWFGSFSGQIISLLYAPSGSNSNSLVTGVSGSPTQLDLTGGTSIPSDFRPNFDVSYILPFVNNGAIISALWKVTQAGKITVQLLPTAAFTPPFGIGTLNVYLTWNINKN